MSPRARVTVSAAVATLMGSMALAPAFATLGWLPGTIVGVALVVGVLEACRRLRVPRAVAPLLALVALLALVTRGWAPHHAWAGFVPSLASLRDLANLAADGFQEMGDLAPPVPATPGLVLITVVGVALLAMVVDLVAVTMKHPALAGLPLLAVFCVGSAVSPHGAGWMPFVLAAVGYQWLLVADGRQRISRWGRSLGFDRAARMVSTWSAEGIQASPVSVVARRVGALAVGLAVVLPMLVPGLHGALGERTGGTGGDGGGSATVTTYNPIVRIRDQLHTSKPVPVLRLRSSDSSPDYLRLTSLDRFDGSTWSASPISGDSRTRVSHGLPEVVTDSTTQTTQTHIDIKTLNVHWLPVSYPPSKVDVKGDWRYDAASGTVFSSRRTTHGLSYDVTTTRLVPTPEQLTRAPAPDFADRALVLPPLPADVVAEAVRVTSSASTNYDKALALQHYFTDGRFIYDDTVNPGEGVNALSAFLFKTRRGFCEQYAAAMAVMARAVGIPARVAVGFTRGTKQNDGSWLVTTHDAHAWPELWFSGIGWVRFEPTPAGGADGQALPPTYATSLPNGEQNPSGVGPGNETNTPGAKGLGTKRDEMLNRGEDNPVLPLPAPATPRPGPHTGVAGIVVGSAALLLLALPALLQVVVRRRRWRRAATAVDAAHAAWDQLHDDARDFGLDWRTSDTPRTAIVALGEEIGGWPESAEPAVRRLVRAEERASYSPEGPGEVSGLRSDVATVRGVLAQQAAGTRRVRAVLLPPSSLRRLRGFSGRAADVLDRSELAVAGLRRFVPGQRPAATAESGARADVPAQRDGSRV